MYCFLLSFYSLNKLNACRIMVGHVLALYNGIAPCCMAVYLYSVMIHNYFMSLSLSIYIYIYIHRFNRCLRCTMIKHLFYLLTDIILIL